MKNISLLKIEQPDNSVFTVDKDKLKSTWINDIEYTKWLGGQILEDSTIVAFSVPSAIVPEAIDIILYPLSKNFSSVKFLGLSDFSTDYMLLGKLLDPAI
ncbi:hypothetical protein [Pseudopedobacter saltans]|uniref:hypothetical protein n=1 Tax=Pseudopedobacter saltans TaxID=151895 RepID=UPI0011D2C591|nr:hypothetical protein [Pseudopedobacter saltans]